MNNAMIPLGLTSHELQIIIALIDMAKTRLKSENMILQDCEPEYRLDRTIEVNQNCIAHYEHMIEQVEIYRDSQEVTEIPF